MSTTTYGSAESRALATDSNPVALSLGEHLSQWLASRPPADAQDDETTTVSPVHSAAAPQRLTPPQAAQNQERHAMAQAATTSQASTSSEAVADAENASDSASDSTSDSAPDSDSERLASDIDRRLAMWEVAEKWQREAESIEPGDAERAKTDTAKTDTAKTNTANTIDAIDGNAQRLREIWASWASDGHEANAGEPARAQALADDLDDRLSKWSTWVGDVEAVEAAKTLNAAADGIAAQAASSLEAKNASPRHGTAGSTSLSVTAVPRTPSALAAMLDLLRELYNAIVALVRWVARKLGLGARSLIEASPATQAAPPLHANQTARNTESQLTTALTHLEDETQAARQQAHDAVAAVKAALHDKSAQAFSAEQQQELARLRTLVNEALRKLEDALRRVDDRLTTSTSESAPDPQLVEYRAMLRHEIESLRAMQGAMSLWPTDKSSTAFQQAQTTPAAQASTSLPFVATLPQNPQNPPSSPSPPQITPAKPDATREILQPIEQPTTPASAQADAEQADAARTSAVTDGSNAARQGMVQALHNLRGNMRKAPAFTDEQHLVDAPEQVLADHTDADQEPPTNEASRPRLR